MRTIETIGRGLGAALGAHLRLQAAQLATRLAGLGLVVFGAGLLFVGATLALAQYIGPIAAFCGSGGALILIGALAARPVQPRPITVQIDTAAAPAAAAVAPIGEVPAATAIVFVMGFVLMRALLRAKRNGGQG